MATDLSDAFSKWREVATPAALVQAGVFPEAGGSLGIVASGSVDGSGEGATGVGARQQQAKSRAQTAEQHVLQGLPVEGELPAVRRLAGKLRWASACELGWRPAGAT